NVEVKITGSSARIAVWLPSPIKSMDSSIPWRPRALLVARASQVGSAVALCKKMNVAGTSSASIRPNTGFWVSIVERAVRMLAIACTYDRRQPLDSTVGPAFSRASGLGGLDDTIAATG